MPEISDQAGIRNSVIAGSEITLRESNPYSNGEVIAFDDSTAELNRKAVTYQRSEKDILYTVQKEDNLRLIAYHQYKNKVENAAEYWHVIAVANDIENPLDLSALIGVEILIPDVNEYKLIYLD